MTLRAVADEKDRNAAGNEIGAFPIVGGDSDIGIGVGGLAAIAHYDKAHVNYRWRLEAGALITYKPGSGHSHFPYQDFYLTLTVLELAKGVRLDLRPSFTKETTQGYYGIGNASVRSDALDHGDFYQYGRTHPTLESLLRFTLGSNLFFLLGNYFTYDLLDIYSNSKLSQDLNSTDPEVRSILGHPATHAVDFVETALQYDTRDDEYSPASGQYHQVELRLSPGGGGLFPYRYEQLNLTTRFYASPFGDRFTLATRVVGDFQFDHPPFYELARFEDTFALGGVNGVRGVPGQRYYGKVKLFGNIEGRFRLTTFRLFNQRVHFGFATFLDAGRLWTSFAPHPELDGTALGLKWGAGAGLRFQQGSTFVVRLDAAYSPDAKPIGAYLGVGEIF